MEEKKCCENGECGKCADKKACCYSKCHCHLFKILIPIIIIAAAFCAGTMVGSRGSYNRVRGENQIYMMRGFNDSTRGIYNTATGEATVNVQPSASVDTTTVPSTVK